MNKVNVAASLKFYDGEDIRNKNDEPVTIRSMIVQAILNETGKPAMEALKLDRLAKRIYDNDEVELTADEIVLIKELVVNERNGFTPLVISSVCRAVDPDIDKDSEAK